MAALNRGLSCFFLKDGGWRSGNVIEWSTKGSGSSFGPCAIVEDEDSGNLTVVAVEDVRFKVPGYRRGDYK